MSIRRIDTLLFLAALLVLVIQVFSIGTSYWRWEALVYVALMIGAVLVPKRWTVGGRKDES